VPKLHVELDGPRLTEVVILKDGQPLTQVIRLAVNLDASTRDQTVDLGQIAIINGDVFTSEAIHTITKATMSIEYEEA
jgi:pseudouridine-5'-phosphate glycosidase